MTISREAPACLRENYLLAERNEKFSLLHDQSATAARVDLRSGKIQLSETQDRRVKRSQYSLCPLG
jgi:ribosomal protein S24E